MLTIKNLTKHFGKKIAVNNVSFTIPDGKIFSLIGPNSSGKSTIVKSVTGLIRPTSGEIKINEIDTLSHPEKAKAQIGYIPDEPSVWSHMTGEEFMYFTQSLFSVPKKERKNNVSKMLATFNLEGVEDQSFEEYSRGNRQKFSISAALAHHPKVLVIDEPIVGLDPNGAETAKQLFKNFASSGGSVLLVTHTLSVAEEISDAIGFLKDGELIVSGTLEELQKKANLPPTSTLEDIYKVLA